MLLEPVRHRGPDNRMMDTATEIPLSGAHAYWQRRTLYRRLTGPPVGVFLPRGLPL